MAKRGRKPKNKQYFGEEQENAVREYLSCEDKEQKNLIYNEILKPAFEKMIESIIRRYKLYIPDETYEETFHDYNGSRSCGCHVIRLYQAGG